MSELQLRQDILDELEFEPRVDAAHVGVAVDKGVVTLTGHVSSYAEKLAAVQAVRRIRGVRAIADDIAVRFVTDKKTADDEIAKRAADILAWDSTLPAGGLQITVRDGLVTLGGDVDWYHQRRAAEDNVRKLHGVTGVVNNIHVHPRIQAQNVKSKIEEALRRNAEIEADSIRVSVEDGNRVVLEGNVHNWDERYAVTTAAWSAPGVRAVENRLAII